MKEKLFTLQEANAALPNLRRALDTIREVKLSLGADASLEVLWKNPGRNGGGKEGKTYLAGLEKISEQLNRITRAGILVRDIDTGLCDFLSMRDGKKVFLCWKADEDSIGYWHETDTGFAGRQPL
ncbi:MAG: DUF2203 domain-containing protein [bacterium]